MKANVVSAASIQSISSSVMKSTRHSDAPRSAPATAADEPYSPATSAADAPDSRAVACNFGLARLSESWKTRLLEGLQQIIENLRLERTDRVLARGWM